jgi:hypothetical protein
VVHQQIALAQAREEVERRAVLAALEPPRRDGRERGVLQLRAIERVERPERAQVERRERAVDVAQVELELGGEQVAHLLGHRDRDRGARPYRAEAAPQP